MINFDELGDLSVIEAAETTRASKKLKSTGQVVCSSPTVIQKTTNPIVRDLSSEVNSQDFSEKI